MIVASKPQKPSADFPLFAHGSGKWAKKIDGRLRYFGRWEDPDGALRDYESLLASATVAAEHAATSRPVPTVNLGDAHEELKSYASAAAYPLRLATARVASCVLYSDTMSE
jgi:hypothetical protein